MILCRQLVCQQHFFPDQDFISSLFGRLRDLAIQIIFANVIYLTQKMFNEQGKLIVIHEYPPPQMKPFLNPICRGTYDALPKIYGKQTKKKYHHHHDLFKEAVQMRCLRQCCTQKEQPQTGTNISKQKQIKTNHFWSLGKETKNERGESKSSVKTVTAQKKQKVILPNLKTFQTEELSESETKHKVCRPLGGTSSLDIESITQSRVKYLQFLTPKESKERKESLTNSNESVQTEEKYFQSTKKNHITFRQRTKTEGDNSQNIRYYEYLQNDPKLKVQKEGELRRANTNKTSDEDTFSISSSAIRQRKNSTMFHKFKVRQSVEIASKRSTKAYSVLSNGLFPIPEEEQFEDYLLKYKPLNPEFDVADLVKQPDFHIIPGNGKVFFGQVHNKKKHGLGISVSEKQIYEGKYQEDMKTYGSEKNRDGVYQGEYLRGKRHGKGKFTWCNGEEFEGEWKNGKKNGFGIWKSPKGDYYEGEWVENRQNGQGYFYHIGGSKYRGQFKDFLKHGQGQQEFTNGDKYTGEYALGKPHGKGKYIWSNGDTYQGQFSEGSRSGYGVLKRLSGQIYEGEFRNDMKDGEGRERYKSGESFEGQYREGERWKGTLRTSQGKVIELTQ